MGLSSRGVVCDLVDDGWMDTELSTTPTKPIKKPLRVSYPRVYVPMVKGTILAGAYTNQGPSIRKSLNKTGQMSVVTLQHTRGDK